MAKSSPKLRVKKPTSLLNKPVKANFKDLFKGLAKFATHTLTFKWEDLPADGVESLAALNLVTEPSELAFELIQRALSNAVIHADRRKFQPTDRYERCRPDGRAVGLRDIVS